MPLRLSFANRLTPAWGLLLVMAGCTPAPPVELDPEVVFRQKLEWQQAREPEAYRELTGKFTTLFNEADISEVSSLASEQMAESTDLDRLGSFLSGFRQDEGAIESLRFKFFDTKGQRRNRQELAVYLAKLSGGNWWDIRFGVDENRELTRLLILDNNFNEDLPLVTGRTPMSLPFEPGEEWYVLWGGDTEERNYHVTSRAQKNAFDFVVRHPFDHKSYASDGKTNEDYYAYGRPVYAPADGVVRRVIDGVEDNPPGTMNPEALTGNTVVIETEHAEFVVLAHLQAGSIRVAEGDAVRTGQLLGSCGNSGNSSEPHLHLHLMNALTRENATGLKIRFGEVVVDGVSVARQYSPVRGDRVRRRGGSSGS